MRVSMIGRIVRESSLANGVFGILVLLSAVAWAQGDAAQSPTEAERAAVAALGKKRITMQIDGAYRVTTISSLSFTGLPTEGEPIADEDLANLKSLAHLRTLHLSGPAITDAGLAYLKELTSLSSLVLSGTSVTEQATAELQKALPNCRVRTSRGPGSFGDRGGSREGGFSGSSRGGGFGGSFGGPSRTSLLGRLGSSEVQAELNLSREQWTKVNELMRASSADSEAYRQLTAQYRQAQNEQTRNELREKLQAEFARLRAGPTPEATAAQDQKVAEILTPEQLTRLKQLRLRTLGTLVFADSEFQAALNLNNEQKTQIEELLRQQRAADSQAGRRDAATARAAFDEWNGKFLAILTDEQRQQREKLLAAPNVSGVQVGEYIFVLLDANADGSLTEEEWQGARGTRSFLTSNNIELKLPSNKEDFGKAFSAAGEAAQRSSTRPSN